MTPIAFDYGGVLRERSELRLLARYMWTTGHVVHVISAIGDTDTGHWEPKIRAEIEALGLPLAGIHIVFWRGEPTAESIYAAGLEKAKVMKAIGADVIFDDSEHVCRAVTDSGLVAIRVGSY